MCFSGVDFEALKQATVKAFGPQSEYEDPENAKYQVGKEDKVRKYAHCIF
jgi:hypothetical protein